MKMVKSLILGSAAGLIAVGGAQAADLPVKAKAVEYVKVCSLYGAGFWYIPGTDTCLKLGGYLRAETNFNAGVSEQPGWNGSQGAQDRFRDYFSVRSRFSFNVDTRTATEYGVVRTFAQVRWNQDTFGGTSTNANIIANSSSAGSGINGLTNTVANGYSSVQFLFLQFAGFTFGKSASAYSSPWHGFPGNITSYLLGGNDSSTGVPNVQYTSQFGNGVSGSIGLDEARVYDRTNLPNVATLANPFGGTVGTNSYGGNHSPDIVGNIRVDQAWGLFQISAAGHNVDATYYTPVAGAAGTATGELSGHPSDKWGFAVQAALNIKNIPTGAGDDIKFDVSYANGATKYIIGTAGTSPNFAVFSGGATNAYQTFGTGATTDGVFAGSSAANGTPIYLTKGWGLRGAFNHNWNPNWSTSLFGGVASIDYDANASALICGKLGYGATAAVAAAVGTSVTTARNGTCNPDFRTYQIGLVTRWTPVKNLTFSAEAQYFWLDQSNSGTFTPTAVPTTLAKPIAVYQWKDQNVIAGNIRVQRNF